MHSGTERLLYEAPPLSLLNAFCLQSVSYPKAKRCRQKRRPMSQLQNAPRLFVFPLSQAADHVVWHSRNAHLHDRIGADSPRGCLTLGGHTSKSRDRFTIATFGRELEADVHIDIEGMEEEDIVAVSRKQCSIRYGRWENCLMFTDDSSCHSTEVHDTKFPFLFLRGCQRKVAVLPGSSWEFGFGGRDQKLFHFRVDWSCDSDQAGWAIPGYPKLAAAPGMEQTIDSMGDEDVLPEKGSLFTSPPSRRQLRWRILDRKLGEGSFGVVYLGIDVDSGRPLAVKMLKGQDVRNSREADILSTFNHVSANTVLGSQR